MKHCSINFSIVKMVARDSNDKRKVEKALDSVGFVAGKVSTCITEAECLMCI